MPEHNITAANEQHKYYPYSGTFHVTRNSFFAAGQDSFTSPPAQNPDMMTSLQNTENLSGVIQRRRGYSLLTNLFNGTPITRMYSFRQEAQSLRELIYSGPGNVYATTETGQALGTIANPIFQPSLNATARMVLSRNFGYFSDGIQGDYVKFDGVSTISNWGIDINNIGALVFGPNDATTAVDQGGGGTSASQGPSNAGSGVDISLGFFPWTNPGGVATSGGVASFTTSSGTNYISGQNFGFSVPGGATITGVSFAVKYKASSSSCGSDISVVLVQAGAVVGTNHATNTNLPTTYTTVTYGGSSDLWGVALTPADVNATNFGIALSFHAHCTSTTFSVQGFITATVYYTVPAAGSWSNVNGSFQNIPGAPATSPASTSASSDLRNGGFGLTPTLTNLITGIQVAITCKTDGNPISLNPILVKAGTAVGIRKTLAVSSTGYTTLTFGSATDLWNTSWVGADINGVATFGVQYNVSTPSGSAVFSVDRVQITIFTASGPLVLGAPGAGNITLLNGRVYFYAFQNSKTGHTSDLSPASLTTGPLTANNQPLSGIPTCLDPQVDTVIIVATADGGDETTLYFLASLPNGTATYTDNTPDSLSAAVTTGPTLLTNNVYQETDEFGFLHGIANNRLPPLGDFPVQHKGRIYMALGHTLFFSKNLDDVTTSTGLTTSKWEEAWPATNQIDVSTKAETISGLMSDGETLWIFTERAIRRLIGDSPQNFQEPEVQFNETGVLNQEVAQIVFYEGQPVGAMWLTPDLRIMASDFNTYSDAGGPVQDVLNSINVAALPTSHAAFVSQGPADYYHLYVPTGDATTPNTTLTYNLRSKLWSVWQPTDNVSASLFNINGSGIPQWLFAANTGNVYFWDSTVLADQAGVSPTSYPVNIKTSWLDFGDSTFRKALNQIIVTTSDTGMQVSIEGAVLNSQLSNTGDSVLSSGAIVTGPFQELFIPLAGLLTKHKWYRLTFTSPANTSVRDVLNAYNIEAVPMLRL